MCHITKLLFAFLNMAVHALNFLCASSCGREFVFALPDHMSQGNPALYMLVESTHNFSSNLYVKAPYISLEKNLTVERGVTRVSLDEAITNPTYANLAEAGTGISKSGVHVISDCDVTIHVIYYADYTADGLLLIPVMDNAKAFYVASYTSFHFSEFALTTSFDDTRVAITINSSSLPVSFQGLNYFNGDVIYASLDHLDALQIHHNADLTGTRITSNKPISVISGNQCAEVPHGIMGCDHIIEQIPPVAFWDSNYIIAHIKGRRHNTFRVLAGYNNTVVNIEPQIGSVVLKEGEFIEKRVSDDVLISIQSSLPVLVVQYAEGGNSDWTGWDPFMAVIPSINQFTDSYVFSTLDQFCCQFLSIAIETDLVNGIRLNRERINRTDEKLISVDIIGQNVSFSVVRSSVATGNYTLTHDIPGVRFGVLMYGFGNDASFGYPLGMELDTAIRDLRLVNGTSPAIGRLEVKIDGMWRRLCTDTITTETANVMCKSLGFGKYGLPVDLLHYGKTFEPNVSFFAVSNLRCTGNESQIDQCDLSLGYRGCLHKRSLILDCASPLEKLVHVTCTPTDWYIFVDIKELNYRFPGSRASGIYFGVNSCTGILENDILKFNVPIDMCLTSQMQQTTTTGDVSVFSNQLVYAFQSPTIPSTIAAITWSLSLTCTVQDNKARANVTYIRSSPAPPQENSTKHPVSLMFYADPNFSQSLSSGPLTVGNGQSVYTKAYIDLDDWTFKMMLNNCSVTPTDTVNSKPHFLLKSGCEVDFNTHLISESTHETKFVFQLFDLPTQSDKVLVECDAVICDLSKKSSVLNCKRQCL